MSAAPEDSLPPLRPRPRDSHKGTMGRVLIIGGSSGLTGAVALAAGAALRSGAGLVTCAVPRSVHAIIEVKTTEAMSLPLPDDGDGHITKEACEILAPHVERSDAVVLGPGIGRRDSTGDFIAELLPTLELPHLVDADGLWHLAKLPRLLSAGHGRRILTPHLGELRALLDSRGLLEDAGADLGPGAERFSRDVAGVLVVKGPDTRVFEGATVWHCVTGNPGMASGGTGDVLAGIIGAFLGRGDPPRDAARRGVHVHGAAGDVAALRHGVESLIASDLIAALPEILRDFPGQ